MNKHNKWSNYFVKIQNKYNLKLSINKPLVIFLDGKDITKSLNHNLILESKKSFNDIFDQTIKHLSKQFNCLAISGVDEVSFIIEDHSLLKKKLNYKNFKTHDIVSLFSQLFYKYFNDRYINKPVYWHCKCSNIPKGKIKSYIRYRSLTIFELKLTYFLKRKQVKNAGKITLSEKKKQCYEMQGYKELKKFEKGKLYYRGKQIDLEKFFYNEIIELPSIERKEPVTYVDITDF